MLRISEKANINYLAIVSRIEKLEPIPNADKLCLTTLNGYRIIVPTTMKVGDIVIYFPLECCISEKFLSSNNLYGISEYEKNFNEDEVKELLDKSMLSSDADEAKELMNEAKSKVGFFNKYGRVSILKLRGEYSCGFVIPADSLENAYDGFYGYDWESAVGTQFDMVGDEKFCWKYIPKIKKRNSNESLNGSRNHRRNQKKMTSFDRIIPEYFSRHYETEQLEKSITQLEPHDTVTISVKIHGSSGIFANIPCNRKLNWVEKIKNLVGFNIPTIEYGNVYSSRNVIKNQYINKGVTGGFYGTDMWYPVNEMLKPFLEEGMTVYGEIVGYVYGTDQPIQKGHDYGCKVGEWKFMPYRITSTSIKSDKKFEWNVLEVDEWIRKIVKEHPELSDRIMFMEILYHGKLRDLYPDLDTEQHWHENILSKMSTEKKWYMEEKEPLCHLYDAEIASKELEIKVAERAGKNTKKLEKELTKLKDAQAPREGVVIRKDDDIFPRAWKLKTKAHYEREKKAHDEGEVDIEEMESLGEEI